MQAAEVPLSEATAEAIVEYSPEVDVPSRYVSYALSQEEFIHSHPVLQPCSHLVGLSLILRLVSQLGQLEQPQLSWPPIQRPLTDAWYTQVVFV